MITECTEADFAVLQDQLGRIPRGVVGIAARSTSGEPLVVAIVLLAFLAPLNSALKQAQQIAALNDEIETTKAEVKSLEEKNENLRDPDYIKRKAREDQYYVEKGKNAVIVTNQEAVDEESEPEQPVRKQAWYLELLESIQETGNTVEKS